MMAEVTEGLESMDRPTTVLRSRFVFPVDILPFPDVRKRSWFKSGRPRLTEEVFAAYGPR